jgi:cobalt-zinc-cadmium efflux system outer membrane protein
VGFCDARCTVAGRACVGLSQLDPCADRRFFIRSHLCARLRAGVSRHTFHKAMFSSFLPFRPSAVLGLAAFLAVVCARAQVTPATSLSLSEVLARVAERNPTLAAQSYGERAAEALIEQAGARPNPTLDLSVENVLGTGRVQGVRGSETTVQASQTFERGGKRDKRVALAGRARDVAAREFAVHRAEILANAARAYIATVAAQERVTLAAESPRLARETVAVIENHVRAGASSPLELARARAALATAQAELARAEAGLVSARGALAATWGGSPNEVPTLATALRVPETLPAQESFRALLAAHPRLDLQAALVASRRAALTLEQSQATTDITASGGVRFLREGSDAAFVAGVSVPLPIRNKNQGNIRATRETLAAAEQASRAIESELLAAFAAAWQELVTAHQTAQSLRRDALPATDEAHTALRHAYAAGSIPLTDVLDAQRALLAIRREILAAEIEYASALVRVEALTQSSFLATAALLSPR